jgi:hypothetical protein
MLKESERRFHMHCNACGRLRWGRTIKQGENRIAFICDVGQHATEYWTVARTHSVQTRAALEESRRVRVDERVASGVEKIDVHGDRWEKLPGKLARIFGRG